MRKQRIITAAICLPLFLVLVWLGGWWLGVLLAVLFLISCLEYANLVRHMHSPQPIRWYVPGIVYLAAGYMCMFALREAGAILWLFLVGWCTDTAAYEVGRRFGKQKLAPKISPNKTWEGTIGGCIAAVVIGGLYAAIFLHVHIITAFFVSLLVSCVGQAGDLLESYVKRRAGVKDSGKLLPGHGGVLDRFDSMLLASIVLYILVLLLF